MERTVALVTFRRKIRLVEGYENLHWSSPI
jgi:hypothetical protein